MKIKMGIIGVLILTLLLLFTTPMSFAGQWSTCSISKVGISASSGYVYLNLIHEAGGTSWEGARSFRVHMNESKAMLAIALTAMTNEAKVSVLLADTQENSLIYALYLAT
jgi:hypothetical protein